ncbi:MAG: hypothetical protein ABMA01_22520 [Chthoniobacteraceae bacterium]
MKKIIYIITALALLTACGGRRQDAGAGDEASKPVRRFSRLIAPSAFLDDTARHAALAQLEIEAGTLANDAAPGSTVHVFDATGCRLVATLKAVPGAPRQRMKALARPLAAARAFLNAPRTGAELDGRVRLPYLVQAVSQLRLPAGSAVVVLGNPLFIGTGSDAYYSMTERVPTDGLLFLDRARSIYSILGRERALAGQYWYMGFPAEGVFLDDSHRERVSRFWSVYLKCQGATLVTFQNGLTSAAKSARDGMRAAFNNDDADPKAEAVMLKVVKVIHERTTSDTQDTTRDEEKKPEPPKPVISKLDDHGNPLGAENDLVPDGALRGQRILLVTFAPKTDMDTSPLPGAIEEKGCEVERLRAPLPPLAAWKAKLAAATQLWLVSSSVKDLFPATHIAAVVEQWKTGRLALYIAGDNEPYTIEANALLKKIAPGAEMTGNDMGGMELHAVGTGFNGFREASPLFHGINFIFEGSTVSSLHGGGFTPACTHSGGGVLIGALDTAGCGRVVADCGFTRWFEHYWKNAGASRLAVNIAGWLANAKPARTASLKKK